MTNILIFMLLNSFKITGWQSPQITKRIDFLVSGKTVWLLCRPDLSVSGEGYLVRALWMHVTYSTIYFQI